MRRSRLPALPCLLVLACSAGGDAEESATTTTTTDASASSSASSSSGASASASASASTSASTSATTTGVDTSTDTSASATATTTSATTDATTSGVDTTGDTETDTGPPPEPAIHYVGRHDASDPAHVRMGWSGVGAVFRFTGTGASVRMDDQARFHTVVVDGAVLATLATSPGEQTYPLAADLAEGEHTIEIYRRTEGSFGPTVITGIDLVGELLPPPPVSRRIEIIGDSITCGYGDEGEAPCSFSAATENHYLTYGAVAARALGAELHTTAWSGKGVIYNYGDDKNQPLPELYDRLLATSDEPWDFAWQADAVVINLGTNDFSTGDDPPEALFTDAYHELLDHLRAVYPGAFILLVAPTLFGDEATMVEGYLTGIVDQRHQEGDAMVGYANVNVQWIGSGCDGHPTVATHAGMADKLIAALEAALGW